METLLTTTAAAWGVYSQIHATRQWRFKPLFCRVWHTIPAAGPPVFIGLCRCCDKDDTGACCQCLSRPGALARKPARMKLKHVEVLGQAIRPPPPARRSAASVQRKQWLALPKRARHNAHCWGPRHTVAIFVGRKSATSPYPACRRCSFKDSNIPPSAGMARATHQAVITRTAAS